MSFYIKSKNVGEKSGLGSSFYRHRKLLALESVVQATSQQSAKDTENEMLKKQIETMSRHAEQMAAQNDHFRQRNENLEGKLRKENDKDKKLA